MTFYQRISAIGVKFFGKAKTFKIGFNWSPMYRRSTGKITFVSKDLLMVKMKLPISYKNRNYVGSIFGGSMFSAVDPIPMIQLMNLLDPNYVVWDKSAQIFFKRPGKENLYAEFLYTKDEVEKIKQKVALEKEIEIIKKTQLTNKSKTIVFCEVHKTVYIAQKAFYKQKLLKRKQHLKKESQEY